MNGSQNKKMIENDAEELLARLYGMENITLNQIRYDHIIDGYLNHFGDGDFYLFSSPGRTEISGNHTDHNQGKVLGASINLDCIAAAGRNGLDKINVISESFKQNFVLDLNLLSPSTKKSGTIELMKGIMAGFLNKGYVIGGFDIFLTSNVIPSAGVSSSAAFEILICQIVNTLFNGGLVDRLEYARIGKYAENVYWNKGSGLLDQMCCAYGGMIAMDFSHPEKPVVRPIDFDFKRADHQLVIVQTGKGHADLSAEYSAIPNEMRTVARYFKRNTLSEVAPEEFYDQIPDLRGFAGDRAILRAIHFFDENERVEQDIAFLEGGNFPAFLENIKRSGESSWKYLQNVYNNAVPGEQGITLALALTERFLQARQAGACRVHGGGFAGVIMVILPQKDVLEYIEYIEGFFGTGSAYCMSIRPLGALCLNTYLQEVSYG